jgi:hypothetical protein
MTVPNGHVAHICCGKLDDAPHHNFCRHYRRTLDEAADSVAVSSLSALITVGVIDKESADAMLAAWRRGGDGGLAERFLQERREAYAEGYVDCVQVVTEMRREKADEEFRTPARKLGPVRLVTEDQVDEVLDGGPAPTGIDPETIAAARRIARRLNGRPR